MFVDKRSHKQAGPQPDLSAIFVPSSSPGFRLVLYIILALSDITAISVGTTFAFAAHPGIQAMAALLPLAAIIPLYAILALFSNAYGADAILALHLGWARATKAFLITLLLVFVLASPFTFRPAIPLTLIAAAIVAAYSLMILGRIVLNLIAHGFVRDQIVASVYLIDDSEAVTPPQGYHALDCRAVGLSPDIADPVMLHRLATLLLNVDRVLVTCPPARRERWATILKGLGIEGGLVAPELERLGIQSTPLAANLPVLLVSKGPLNLRNRVLKRGLDLAITVPVLIALTPPMIVIALAIKLDSPGPVIFKQQRIGRRNHLFNIYKFRSMRVESSDGDGARSTSRDDDRVTRVGSIIRKTSLDELPQLFNVLLGDMSLVGPRPHALGSRAQNLLFWEIDSRYFIRHAVKPGITGIAQVRGYRGATHRREDLTDRLRSDLEYLSEWSVWIDLVIMLRTVRVLFHKNAY